MTLSVTTRSDDGFESTSAIRAFSTEIDPAGEDAPDTLESLLAAYAACYIPALRVTAQRRELGDLGVVEIDVEGELDDGKLDSIAFDITTDADLQPDDADRLVSGANDLCKVHAALRPGLYARITIDGHTIE